MTECSVNALAFLFYFVDNVQFLIWGFKIFALLLYKTIKLFSQKTSQFRYNMELAALENSYQENPIRSMNMPKLTFQHLNHEVSSIKFKLRTYEEELTSKTSKP